MAAGGRTVGWRQRLARGGLTVVTRVWRAVVPRWFRLRLDPEEYSNDLFARSVGQHLPAGAIVLDVGAGTRPYQRYFSHTRYMSMDLVNTKDPGGKPIHELIGTGDALPVRPGTLDAIFAFQVLEHVPEPERTLGQLYAALRPGGHVYITVPQGWGLHLEPHHYFNFTRYGLGYLLSKTGFRGPVIEERGGIFWMLAKRLRILPNYVLFQYLYPLIRPDRHVRNLSESKALNCTFSLVLIPSLIITIPLFMIMVPFILFYADRLDRQRLYTLGYRCSAEK